MMVHARTITAAIAIGILGLAGTGAMPGSSAASDAQFEERWGDLDCNGAVGSNDARLVLMSVTGGFIYFPEGICEDAFLFQETLVQIEGGSQVQWADVDCNGKISAVDALWILRYVVGMGVPEFAGCPEIGAMTTLSHVAQQFASASTPVPWETQWGDVDCSRTVSNVDALKVLRWVAGLRVLQADVCYYPEALVQIVDGPEVQWFDVDCDGAISSVDALWLLRHVVGFGLPGFTDCPEIGANITVS